MALSIHELSERAKKPEDFDGEEVRQTIDQFSQADLDALEKDRKLVKKLVEDLQNLQQELKKEFVGRDEAIEMALACFIAHLNMLFLGPPGTAKSLVVRRLSYGLGLQSTPMTIGDLSEEIDELLKLLQSTDKDEQATTDASMNKAGDNGSGVLDRRYFEVLLTRYSTSDEILGPANLQLMIRRAMFYRQTTGLLPEAEVAFLDEIWKANSAILNALLSIANERIFYNAGKPVRVPLCMIYGASNEVPREEELWAMYDRFPVRVICDPVDDSRQLLKKSAEQAHRSLVPSAGKGKSVKRCASVNHFRLLFRAIHCCFGADSKPDGSTPFATAFCETFDSLKREFQISDRSLYSLYRLALALALLRGHGRPQSEELEVFKFSFHDPETAPALRDAVDQRISRYRELT